MADNSAKLHIAMLPWLAFGHIIPFLSLAKLIASKGHQISFISTPRNIDRLPKIPPNLSNLIKFVKIPLPTTENLPKDAEATIDLPFDKVTFLKIAYDRLREPVADFLKSDSPDWILFDFAPYWVGSIAAKLNIRSAFFSVFPAAMLCYGGPPKAMLGEDDRKTLEDFTRKPKWVPFDSTVGVRYFQMLRVAGNYAGGGEDVGDMCRMGTTVDGCDAVVVRTSSDFEAEWVKLLEELYPKPVIQAGLMPAKPNHGDDDGGEWPELKEWLGKQEKGSVVYIGFGTETKPSQTDLTQLALGLELSGLPFFWALIKRRGLSDPEATELPDEFIERTRGRGMVCTGWAPQLRILSHDSVGGLLIHGGWSSVVEAFQFGRALILLPFTTDQGLIESELVEKELGYSVPRNELDGSFTSESVAESLKLVLVKEEGKMYREKAKEMKVLFSDMDKQDKYVEDLLSYFQNHKIIE